MLLAGDCLLEGGVGIGSMGLKSAAIRRFGGSIIIANVVLGDGIGVSEMAMGLSLLPVSPQI